MLRRALAVLLLVAPAAAQDTVVSAEAAAFRAAQTACAGHCVVITPGDLAALAEATRQRIDEAHFMAELAATENAQLREQIARCRR